MNYFKEIIDALQSISESLEEMLQLLEDRT